MKRLIQPQMRVAVATATAGYPDILELTGSTQILQSPDDLGALLGVPPARLHQFFERQADATPGSTALVSSGERLSYAELEERANRLAHFLTAQGAGPGRTVGIYLERSVWTYVSVLAVLKSGAAFVPIDASYPADRVAFIAGDAGLAALVTTSRFRDPASAANCRVIELDDAEAEIECCAATRPDVEHSGDAVAYIIYTSGTTGRPKGVAVRHSNITHFLSVCTPIYGVSPDDRVYQGMTIAFDFSIEEIWPTWIAGAALIAGPNDARSRIGSGLAEFLDENGVTMLYCVPTLLATIDRDLPNLHTLIVGGEVCPRDLVERWSTPSRRILNTYGPTETTVTATWTELYPHKPVTIGRPMPGYRIYILDEHLRPVSPGGPGEIYIGGLGVAQGYVNRPDLTAAKFVADPFDKDRPHARMYRSGDLGRFSADGEVEFLGRIDSQVKIRGYRIELGEIEAVLLEDPGVENAIVSTVPAGQPAQDLAAYITIREGCGDLDQLRDRLALELRRRVPVYMVPAYIEVLAAIPMLASGKADRKLLPEPKSGRLAFRSGAHVAPETADESALCSAWAAIFGRDDISVVDDFFLDLGGHSLFAAQAISKLRNEPRFRHLSVGDLYANPSVRALAGFVAQNSRHTAPVTEREAPLRQSDRRVRLAGLAQFGLAYAMLAILGAPFAVMLAQHVIKHAALSINGLDLALPMLALLMSVVMPIVLKWTLIGRFRAGTYPLWGSYHLRWWIVRKSFEYSPMHLLAGSPLMNVYARLMGARVGRGAHLSTAQLHLPDLIEIEDGVSLGYEVELQPYAVEGGRLQMAPIKIGRNAFVGTKAVLLAGAVVGEDARVAEQTLVTRGQCIPAGETWSGSPARPVRQTDSVLDAIEAKPAVGGKISPPLWLAFGAAFAVLETLPLALALPGLLVVAEADRLGGPLWALMAAPVAGLLFVIATCLVVWLGKRTVMPHARPGIYPVDSWFGLRKWAADRLMTISLTLTNTLYATLYTVPWLRALGARVGRRSEVSTVSQIDPDLLVLGEETFVADLASVGAATYHQGYVSLDRTVIGDRTFLGNASVVRSRTNMPQNCLIGVQSVVPHETPQTGTSWLGSPAIFLPRRQTVGNFDESVTYRPTAKLVAYRLFVEFFRIVLPPALIFLLGTLVTLGAARLARSVGSTGLVLLMPAVFFLVAIGLVLLVAGVKWAMIGKYRPRVEPLWAPFVRHSEFVTGLWESAVVPVLGTLFTGTPMMAWLLRLFGARAGKRCFIESTFVTEFDLVHIGDDCSIGRATSLQTHLFEDRVMKMSVLRIGNGCTVGTRAVVLYDSKLEDEATLEPLSLAMKGESLPAGSQWRGIPSQLVG